MLILERPFPNLAETITIKYPVYWNILREVSTLPERPAFYSVVQDDVANSCEVGPLASL